MRSQRLPVKTAPIENGPSPKRPHFRLKRLKRPQAKSLRLKENSQNTTLTFLFGAVLTDDFLYGAVLTENWGRFIRKWGRFGLGPF